MTDHIEDPDQITKWLRWIARIWSLPLILYALLTFIIFAWSWVTTGAADPYAVQGYPLTEALPPILMFLGILGLGIAWRWERLGGLIDLLFQAAVIIVLLITRPILQDFSRSAFPYILVIVATISGILFLLSWRRSMRLLLVQNNS